MLWFVLLACGTPKEAPGEAVPAEAGRAEAPAEPIAPAPDRPDQITISEAWATALPPAAPSSALFFRLWNPGPEAHIVSASTPAAGRAELHLHVREGDLMKMRRTEYLTVPAEDEIRLKPGGAHVMLFDLPKPIEHGQEVPFTVTLDDGRTLEGVATGRRMGPPPRRPAEAGEE